MSYLYFRFSTRGFSNEDEICRITSDQEDRVIDWVNRYSDDNSQFSWITREQAQRWTAMERQQMAADKRANGGRLPSGTEYSATSIQDWEDSTRDIDR
jgi:hypothetical protein